MYCHASLEVSKNSVIFGYIYKTTLLLDGRIYIGQKRGSFTSKYIGSGKHLNLAINKYGRDNFICELVQYANSQQELDDLEKKFIAEARENIPAESIFNISEGGLKGIDMRGENNPAYGKGGTFRGRKHSEETKKLMSIARKNFFKMPGAKENIASKRRGRKHSEETKKRWSDLRTGKNLSGFTSEHYSNMAKKRGAPWNKGLTKETNATVAKMAQLKSAKIR